MTLINPETETRLREVDSPDDFHRQMERRARRGGDTRVKVVLQIRAEGQKLADRQITLSRSLRQVKRDGGSDDEALEHAAREMRGSDPAGWIDYQEFWAGDYAREEPVFPEPGLLTEIENETGAAEARAVLKTVI